MIQLESKFSKIIGLALLSLLSGLVFYLIAIYLCSVIFGVSISEVNSAISELQSPQQLSIAKIILFFNSVGLFAIPALLYVYSFEKKPFRFLKLNRSDPPSHFFYVILLFIVFVPVVNLFVELNKMMVLPDFLSELENWMKVAEESAERMTLALLRMDNISDLIINVILIGVIPAIGEELIFRGIVQQVFIGKSKNYHIGIWLSAALFSAIHLQFYGFLPRLFLGALFGYLYYWSSNLWIPIFAHFINNSTAVIISYYFRENGLEDELEKVGTTNDTWYISIIFTIIFIYFLYRFKNLEWRNKVIQESSYST